MMASRSKRSLCVFLLAGAMCTLPAQVARGAESGAANFERTDRNGDGRIGREEYRTRMVEVFYQADVNRDGWLTQPEVLTSVVPSFIDADVNQDGKLDLGEFINYRYRDFDAADRNGDGYLTPAEAN